MVLTLTPCTDVSVWDAFVAASPQKSIFCRRVFLNALDVRYDLWLVDKNGEPQAGAVVVRANDERSQAAHLFTMYQWVVLAGHGVALPPHRRASWTLEVTQALLTGLTERYDRLSLYLHHGLEDLRGVQWFHYNEPHLGQFRLDLYYTGLLNLRCWSDYETYFASIRATRRYEYRRALSQGMTVEVSKDIDTLDSLHGLTFERQGLRRKEEEHRWLRGVTAAALEHGFGELLICRNAQGEAASATLFLYDEHTGYWLFGGNHPAYRNSGSGTLLLLENIRRCRLRGVTWVDVGGINSPNRGDFKTSFNAVPVPYFLASWENPSWRSVDAK